MLHACFSLCNATGSGVRGRYAFYARIACSARRARNDCFALDCAAGHTQECSHNLSSAEELTISVVQVGNDQKANKWLDTLDTDLKGCKYDIVDKMGFADMKGKSFSEFIEIEMRMA